MNWMTFFLTWIAISIFTLGTYIIFVWFAKTRKEMNSAPFGQSYIEPKSLFENEWKDLEKLYQAIDDGLVSMAPHLCLRCAHLISESDKIPYCTRCFQQLEREGFFDDYVCTNCGKTISSNDKDLCMACFQDLIVSAYSGNLDALDRLQEK